MGFFSFVSFGFMFWGFFGGGLFVLFVFKIVFCFGFFGVSLGFSVGLDFLMRKRRARNSNALGKQS